MFWNKKMSLLLSNAAFAVCAFGANPPLPEIAAWEETPDWCRAYAKVFPLDYLAGNYTICENLPAMLMLHTNAGEKAKAELKQTDAPSCLVLELPAFLKLEGVCVYETRGGKFPLWKVTEQKTIRDGAQYRSYKVFFDSQFRTELAHWFKQQICITAAPGSAGKSGRIYYQTTIGGRQQAERVCDVKVLPPLLPNQRKTTSFHPLVWISTTTSSFTPQAKQMIGYWNGLSSRFSVYDRRKRSSIDPSVYKLLQEKADRSMFLLFNETLIDLNLPESPQQFYKDVSSGRMRGKLPMEVTDRGKVLNTLPIWYLVEDPAGLYDKYLTDGFTGIRNKYPEIRELIWDFEYYKVGYDPENLKRFGKYLGLKKAPSAFEAKTRYAREFNDYMTDLCEKLVWKTTKKMRKILPSVRWILCSSMPKKGYIEALARTQLKADEIVDGHIPMAYYSGKRFFDDIAFCTSVLKKPFIALNNPAERYSNWFDLYSPMQLKQNMIAAAALGCGGFGFWPNDMLPGSYFYAISQAFSEIAFAEPFYKMGKRCDDSLKIEPQDLYTFTQNGVSVTLPYSRSEIKHTVHEYNGKKLLTVLNYSPLESFLQVSLDQPSTVTTPEGKQLSRNGKTVLENSFLCRIPAMGCGIYRIGKNGKAVAAEDQKELQQALNEKLRKRGEQDPFAALRKHGDRITLKRHFAHAIPVVALNNGTVEALLDPADGGSVRGLEFLGKKQLFTENCYLGKLMLVDAANMNYYNGFQFDGIQVSPAGTAVRFSCVIPESACGETHRLSGLQIEKEISLQEDHKIVWKLVFHNPTRRNMDVEFRLHNIPCGGTANLTVDGQLLTNAKAPLLTMYAVPEAQISFLNGRVHPQAWSGKAYTFDAARAGVPYRWTFASQGLAGVFFNNNRFFTVEPVSGKFELKPGETRKFLFSAQPRLR